MCGMTGAYSTSKLTEYELRRIYRLSLLNTFRGLDQGGMFFTTETPEKESRYVKTDQDSLTFIRKTITPWFNDWCKKDAPIMIGVHLRAATKGTIEKKNGHPFVHKGIMGMHNGTVHDGLRYDKEFDTDSEAIFKSLGEHGLQDTINQIGDKNGAAALIWVNIKENTLNFWRNYQRPLHYYRSGNTVYWSSDGKDLAYEFSKEHIYKDCIIKNELGKKIEPVQNGIREFDPHKHYKIDLDGKEMKWVVEEAIPEWRFRMEEKKEHKAEDWLPWYGARHSTADVKGDNVRRLPIITNDIRSFVPAFNQPPDNWREVESATPADWLTKGYFDRPPHANQDGMFYAIEFNKFYYSYEFNRLMYWRAENPDLFLMQFRKVWQTSDRAIQAKIMQASGLSRNKLKKLAASRDNAEQTEFIYNPWVILSSGEVCHNKRLYHYYKDLEEKAEKKKEEKRPLMMTYGASQKVCTEDEYKQRTKPGCCICTETTELKDDIFWINDENYICETCQENAISSARHTVYEQYRVEKQEIVDHVKERFERNYQKLTGTIN